MSLLKTVSLERLPHGEGLPLPSRATERSSGLDLSAAVGDPIVIEPGGRAMIPTGFRWEIGVGFEGQVRPRSGLAIKHGVTCLNSPGTVDGDFRGEVCVILVNHGEKPFVVERGQRIAQMVISPVAFPAAVEAPSLTDTERGHGGFGSSGH